MRENVTIWYRGASYQLGRGYHGYAIWPAGGPPEQPLEQWPETPAGWTAAWTRFNAVEAPGTIAHLGPPPDPAPAPAATQFSGPPAAAGSSRPAAGPVPAGPEPFTAGAGPASPGPAFAGPASPGPASPGPASPGPASPGPASPGPASPGPASPGAAYGWAGGPAAAADTGPARPGIRSAWAGARSAWPLSAAILLAFGVAFGLAGLFPAYLSGASLAQEPAELVPHVIYLAVWTASALLIVSGGIRTRMGALLALGMSIVTFGFFFADLGTVISGGAHLLGPGLVLGLIGWLACMAGSVLAFRLRSPDAPRKLDGREMRPAVTLTLAALAAIGTAVAFAPSWDSYTLRTATGLTQFLSAGNAFANPAPVIIGDVAVMVTLVAVVIIAALWRPVRLGALLLAGAAIPMVGQAISAIIQVTEPVSASSFGIPPAQAAGAGLTISTGLTPAFWAYCAFLVALLLAGAWMFMPQRPRRLARTRPGGGAAPATATGTGPSRDLVPGAAGPAGGPGGAPSA